MESLVMPFEDAVRFKKSGGTQDTQFYWIEHNNDKHELTPKGSFAYRLSTEYSTTDKLYAAPIIKTEIEV